MGRRVLLKRGAVGAAAIVGGTTFLTACGGSDSPSNSNSTAPSGPPAAADVTGQAVFLNYPGWIGPHDVSNFQKKFPEASIKQTASGFESTAGVAQTVAQNPSAYDMLLGDVSIAQQLDAGKFVLPVDQSSVPGLQYVEDRFVKAFPYGLPWECGFAGIAYRSDIVKESISSWADFWNIVPKYSGKVMMVGVDRAAIGSALVYKGYDTNTTDPDEIDEAGQALMDIRSDIRAFKVTGIGQSLLTGDAVLAASYNFDAAAAQQKDPRIKFVVADEGSPGYVEGIIGVAQTDVATVVRAFMDFEIQPENYGAFINTVASSRTSTAADDMIDPAYLTPAMDMPDNAEIFQFLGADGVKKYSDVWSAVQAG
jgi:spermidine/putrescine transport system substrate-binding protein